MLRILFALALSQEDVEEESERLTVACRDICTVHLLSLSGAAPA